MTVKEIKTSELKPYKNNPRHNESAVGAVAESIKQFGFKVPIVIDANNVIIAGHTRHKAAERLGLETVPCIIADDLTPEQAAAFRLADNKTGEFSSWDYNKLAKEIEDINDEVRELAGVDLAYFGFEIEDISAEDFDDDFTLPDSEIPQARTITLTLCPTQYEICEKIIDLYLDRTLHDFGNEHEKSNALFEAVYQWAHNNGIEVEYEN